MSDLCVVKLNNVVLILHQIRSSIILVLLSCPSSPNLVICLARLLHSGEPSHQQLPDLPGCIHFQEVGISVGAAWSALRSRIHRLYLLYQHSPIYSCWFCCGHTRAESVEGFPQLPLRLWPGANCSLVGIGSFARCCFADRCSSHNVSLAV